MRRHTCAQRSSEAAEVATRAGKTGRKILFATSNGTGLGHLNRAMSIARRLPDGIEPVIFTLSQAAPVVVRNGFRAEYFPSYRRPGSGSDFQWNLSLRARLEALIADERPDLVVFDGIHPYRALTHVLTASGAPRSVWCRRPLWRPDSNAGALERTGAFDAVLEPGELAEALDAGATVPRRDEAKRVAPIVYLDRDELLTRKRAARELGLDPDRTTALVNLGQGGATDAAVERVLARLAEESGGGDGLQIAALESSIGSEIDAPEGIVRLRSTFPMSKYFAAFDFAVAACGYNAFHELIAFGVPSLFVPMPRNTDDQFARARWAAEEGAGRAVDGVEDPALEDELVALLDTGEREQISDRCGERWGDNGAEAAAEWLAGLAEGERPKRSVRRKGRFHRWYRHSSHPVGPSLPLAVALTARDLVSHPERRRPKAIVYALDVPEDEFEQELEAAIDSFGVPRERVMVITDSLELAMIRRMGAGVHRVPAPAELGLDFDDRQYRRLLEERFELALGRWRGKWPLKRIGRGNEVLREEAAARPAEVEEEGDRGEPDPGEAGEAADDGA